MQRTRKPIARAVNSSFERLEDRQFFSTVQFGTPTPYVVGDNTVAAVASGDFNHDGNVDLAIITRQSGSTNALKWMAGDGSGKLAAPKTLAALPNPEEVVTGDFNGDGRDDLAATSSAGLTVF